MRWLLRPWVVLVSSLLVVVLAGYMTLATRPTETAYATPLPVGEHEHEIVWLYSATSAATWERFVTAINTKVERWRVQEPSLDLYVDDSLAFPPQTALVPELRVKSKSGPTQLVFRWYKLTGAHKVHDWVASLLQRKPAPLAIIGGSTSDAAIELARELAEHTPATSPQAESPLLFVTTGTTTRLHEHYAHRTFRFCFNNRSMAEAVTKFIFQDDQENLRPEADPIFVTTWDDDPYSEDLRACFYDSLNLAGGAQRLPTPQRVSSSVGQFDQPNRGEQEAANFLLQDLGASEREAKRRLLVLPAQVQPSRRFLRALMQLSPTEAKRFVVATGDTISFNTLYRDRSVAWPIQDLPFTLVAFCHRNPVAAQLGFRPVEQARPGQQSSDPRSATGTDDLLLFRDIVEVLLQASFGSDNSLSAEILRQTLREARLQEGQLVRATAGPHFFDEQGDRSKQTGEHVLCLRPQIEKSGRVLPEAKLSVWTWTGPDQPPQRLAELVVPYRRQAMLELPTEK